LGIEFTNQSTPQIWYPGDCKNVIIQITENCLDDLNCAVFKVAHESIHCLCPTGGQNANVLEGLANLFSIEYCRDNGHGDTWRANKQEYTDASNLLSELLVFDSNIIKKLRAIEPTISKFDKALIHSFNATIPESLIDKLIRKFLEKYG